MATTYQWREGARIKNITAPTAARRINAIRAKLKRDVRVGDILDDARRPESPLHPAFEWDDTVAAEQYRRWQASSLLVSIEIVDRAENGHDPIRAFVRVMREEDKAGYMPIADAMRNSASRKQILRIAEEEAKLWAKRYRRFQEFARIVSAIESTVGAP